MCMPLHSIQEIHETHEKIIDKIYGNFPKHVPIQNGIPNDLSPVAIILVYPKSHYNKLIFTFGEYAQVQICTKNNTNKRKVGEIALCSEN